MSAYIHPTAVVDEGAEIGEGTKVWHFCHIEGTAKVGAGCSIGQNAYVGQHVTIGEGCKLQNNVSVYQGVTLGRGVFCGPSCVFTNDLTPRAKYPKGSAGYKRTLVKEGASIGANATVVCGHTVGKWALIGAGAVVASDVPDHALMLGVPARQAGWVCECGQKLRPNGVTYYRCPDCGRNYRLCNDSQIEEIK